MDQLPSNANVKGENIWPSRFSRHCNAENMPCVNGRTIQVANTAKYSVFECDAIINAKESIVFKPVVRIPHQTLQHPEVPESANEENDGMVELPNHQNFSNEEPSAAEGTPQERQLIATESFERPIRGRSVAVKKARLTKRRVNENTPNN